MSSRQHSLGGHDTDYHYHCGTAAGGDDGLRGYGPVMDRQYWDRYGVGGGGGGRKGVYEIIDDLDDR